VSDVDDISAKLAEARPWFESWRSPSEFADRYGELRPIADASFQFNRGEAKWLLEAWIIAKFGRLRGFSKIKLNRVDPPDAFVLSEAFEIPIEITEVLEPGRQRGREYRLGESGLTEDPVENWVSRADKLPLALETGVGKKQKKQYSKDTELLVYLNINEFGIRQVEIEAEIKSILVRPTTPFFKIHVLWKEKLFDSSGGMISDPEVMIDEDMGDDEEIFRAVTSN
jgi:hypothetical protein